jgi:hypothetical protein
VRTSPKNRVCQDQAQKEDVPLLYWSAASWGSAISLGLDRVELVGDFPAVRVLADLAMRLDPDWSRGALYELMMTLDSLPEAMGGAPANKRDQVLKGHFDQGRRSCSRGCRRAVRVDGRSHRHRDKDPSEFPKLRETYTKLLEQALAIDPEQGQEAIAW